MDLVVYGMLLYYCWLSVQPCNHSDLSVFGIYEIFRFAHFGAAVICYPVQRVAWWSLSVDSVTFVAGWRIGLGLDYTCHSHSE